jgi:hypothetical protein
MWLKVQLQAADGLNATEMNAGHSAAEWNPVSIVAKALRKGKCITCALTCARIVCHDLQQIVAANEV